MMAGLFYHGNGKPAKLTFEIIEKAYRLDDILRWCRRLIRYLAGAKAILIWDRLQAHRSKVVRSFLSEHGVEVVLLPGYAPQLNPTEWLWANLKGSELANFCAEDIADAEDEARRGVRRIRRRLSLLEGFLAGAGLSCVSKCQPICETSVTTCCATRSPTVGMPNGRVFPSPFGISTVRTGGGK
jgi:transposase